MCLIIHREKGSENIRKEFFEDVHKNNEDGWGIAYAKQDGSSIKMTKGLKFEDFWNLYRSLESSDIEMIIHFRRATVGEVSLQNCHPFRIGDLPIAMVHNGADINHPFESDCKKKSDTVNFIEQVIEPMLTGSPDPYELIRSDHFQFLLEQVCGTGNRLAFVDPQGVTLINTDIWSETTFGTTVSNSYAYDLCNPKRVKKVSYYGANNSMYSNGVRPLSANHWSHMSATTNTDQYSSQGNLALKDNKEEAAITVIGDRPAEDPEDIPESDITLEVLENMNSTPSRTDDIGYMYALIKGDWCIGENKHALSWQEAEICVKYLRQDFEAADSLVMDAPELAAELINELIWHYIAD